MKKILLMNGPNLNMLGVRDPAIYGTDTLEAIEEMVRAYGAEHGCEVDCFQSNHEGALIDRLHAAHGNYDGIVYNPGAHTHYSYALHDAVECIDVPVVEIHISDISKRPGAGWKWSWQRSPPMPQGSKKTAGSESSCRNN